MNRKKLRAATAVAAVMCSVSWASAREVTCGRTVTRRNVVPCALKASLVVRSQRDELDVARARELAVSPWLPQNPTLSLSGSRRSTANESATNWNATVAQELEIAGQRGLRRESARWEIDAQRSRVVLSERDVAANALSLFYEVLAAREEKSLAERLTVATKGVSTVAHAKAEKGLIAPVDADVADATNLRAVRELLAANRKLAAWMAALATLLGFEPSTARVEVEGALEPPAQVDALAQRNGGAEPTRPELQALEAERRSMELRASAFRRSRVPNPTLSAFIENDGFNERVLGLGVSFPIPVPGNVGRTYIGEVAEAEALAHRATTEKERVRRELRLAIVTATRAFESRRTEVDAFTPELLRNAEDGLAALSQEVENGGLTVREAVVAQQTLIELLQGHVNARRELCLASIDLARALGLPLERGLP